MLGHVSASMTLDRYADLFDDDLDAVAGRLDAVHTRTAQSNGTETSAASPPAQPTTNNDRRGSTFSAAKGQNSFAVDNDVSNRSLITSGIRMPRHQDGRFDRRYEAAFQEQRLQRRDLSGSQGFGGPFADPEATSGTSDTAPREELVLCGVATETSIRRVRATPPWRPGWAGYRMRHSAGPVRRCARRTRRSGG